MCLPALLCPHKLQGRQPYCVLCDRFIRLICCRLLVFAVSRLFILWCRPSAAVRHCSWLAVHRMRGGFIIATAVTTFDTALSFSALSVVQQTKMSTAMSLHPLQGEVSQMHEKATE